MKKLITALMIVLSLPLQALADCDFSKGITKVDGGYLYTTECHVAVGQMRQNYLISQQQISDLNKALDLKDLAITKADQRADMWMNTTFKLEDRINTLDKMQETNKWIWFGLGVVTVFAAGYAARAAYGH